MKIDQLTFTRFIAAILVVVYHYGQQIFPFNLLNIKPLVEKFNVSVSYFFLLSGFIMTYVYYPRRKSFSTLEFLRFRFARIYPLYIIAILLYIWVSHHYISGKALALNYFMLQAWFPEFVLTINYPGWSVSVEVFFYLMFPFLLRIYDKINLKKLPLILTGFILSGIAFFFCLDRYVGGFETSNFYVYAPIMHLFQFVAGNLAGMLMIQRTAKNYDMVILALFILLSFFLFHDFSLPIYHGGLAFIFIPFILILALNNGKISRALSKKPLIILGEISYGIYLLQAPIHLGVSQLNSYLQLNDIALFYVYLLVLIGTATISYYFVETPFRRQIRRFRNT